LARLPGLARVLKGFRNATEDARAPDVRVTIQAPPLYAANTASLQATVALPVARQAARAELLAMVPLLAGAPVFCVMWKSYFLCAAEAPC
jgi:hypothetical protein